MRRPQDRRRLWRSAVRRATARQATQAVCLTPGTSCVDTLLSDIDRIADALCTATGLGKTPRGAAAVRKVLLGHAAELSASGLPGTAAIVRGLVEQIDDAPMGQQRAEETRRRWTHLDPARP
jgi:hypothetical protein